MRLGRRRDVTRDNDVSYDEHAAVATGAEHEAAGVKAVMVSLQRGLESMGALRTAAALARLNQRKGFDCPGCAWPEEHGGRKFAEFCENGAKAVAEEATKRVVTPEFFARHSIADLEGRPEYWLLAAGPAHPPDGAAPRRRPLPADRLGRRVPVDRRRTARAGQPRTRRCSTRRGAPATRPRSCISCWSAASAPTTCPTAPTCATSRPAHALIEAIGIGKGSVTVEDVIKSDLIVICRAESRHQPSTDAVDAGEGQGQRRQDHRGQPAAGGGADPVQGSAEGARRRRTAASRSPTSSSRSASAATWRCSPDWAGCCWRPTTRHPARWSTASSSPRTAPNFDEYEAQTRSVDIDTVLEATGIERDAARAGRENDDGFRAHRRRAGRWG